jgi:hypothetical protein
MHVPSGWLWIDEGGLVEQEALDRAAVVFTFSTDARA